MNYKLLKTEIDRQIFSREELAQKIGMSYSGLRYIFSVEDMKVSILELLCAELNKHPADFFDDFTWPEPSKVEESAAPYNLSQTALLQRNNQLLEQILQVIELRKNDT